MQILHFSENVQKGSDFPEWGVSDDPSLYTMMMADYIYLVEPNGAGASTVKNFGTEFSKRLTAEDVAIALISYETIT